MLISKQCSSEHSYGSRCKIHILAYNYEHCLTCLSFDLTNDFGVSYKANEPKTFPFTKYLRDLLVQLFPEQQKEETISENIKFP